VHHAGYQLVLETKSSMIPPFQWGPEGLNLRLTPSLAIYFPPYERDEQKQPRQWVKCPSCPREVKRGIHVIVGIQRGWYKKEYGLVSNWIERSDTMSMWRFPLASGRA
jgi:hypothetical protein